MALFLLAATVVFAVVATSILKISGGPISKPLAFTGVMVGMALIVLVGVWWFKVPMSALKLAFLCMIAVGTVGLKLLSDR